MRRLSRWTIAIALLPFAWACVKHVALMVPAVAHEGAGSWWLYLAGAGAYLAVELAVEKPMWLYVFGHELTHAVSGILSGAKIHSFEAHSGGGEVRLSKSNAFIALSPYVVPIYALVVVGVFVAARHWWNRPELPYVFKFLLGMTLAFHVSLTFSAVHTRQPDLKLLGLFLSSVLIVVGNALIFGVLAVSLFERTPTMTQFASRLGVETFRIWESGIKYAAKEWNIHRTGNRLRTALF